jgi:hypothetical protein
LFGETQRADTLLLANLEKVKELHCIFLRVLQMEDSALRLMKLENFLHGKSRDCGAVTWRLSGAMGRVIG